MSSHLTAVRRSLGMCNFDIGLRRHQPLDWGGGMATCHAHSTTPTVCRVGLACGVITANGQCPWQLGQVTFTRGILCGGSLLAVRRALAWTIKCSPDMPFHATMEEEPVGSVCYRGVYSCLNSFFMSDRAGVICGFRSCACNIPLCQILEA